METDPLDEVVNVEVAAVSGWRIAFEGSPVYKDLVVDDGNRGSCLNRAYERRGGYYRAKAAVSDSGCKFGMIFSGCYGKCLSSQRISESFCKIGLRDKEENMRRGFIDWSDHSEFSAA